MDDYMIGSEIIECFEIERSEEEDKFTVTLQSRELDIETSSDSYSEIFNFLNQYPHISDPSVTVDIHENQAIEVTIDIETENIINAAIIGCEAFFEALEKAGVNGRPTEPA